MRILSVLCFVMPALLQCQDLQASLRGSLRQARSESSANATNPHPARALVHRILAEQVPLTSDVLRGPPITEAECMEVDAVLEQGGDKVSMYRDFWGLICEDPELRMTLSEMKDGCLYVPTNAHLSKFVEMVGRFNTNYFAHVFENQFFLGDCPTRTPRSKRASLGGDVVLTCPAGQVGFVGVGEDCILVDALGHTSFDSFNLTLMTVEGNLGLGQEWHEAMKESGVSGEVARESPGSTYAVGSCMPSGSFTANECCTAGYEQISTLAECHDAYNALKTGELSWTVWGGNAPRSTRPSGCFIYTGNNNVHFNPTDVVGNGQSMIGDDMVICKNRPLPEGNRSLQALPGPDIMPTPIVIPTSFIICDGSSGDVRRQVSEEQLEEQVNVLNMHFAGGDQCSNQYYEPPLADVKMLFRYDGNSTVTDERCATQCRQQLSLLRNLYAPWENGKLKVLICGLYTLGTSCHGCSPAIRADTLPGGSLRHYNLGKTLTHELGHTFNLRHTFKNGCNAPGDEVADTNSEERAAVGCPRRSTCGSLDPVHNYMDYSYDECMCSFTEGQRTRMLQAIQQSASLSAFVAPVADQGACSCCNPNRCCPGGGCPCNGQKNAEFAVKYDELLANPSCLADRLGAIGKDPSRYTQVPRIGGQCCSEECFSLPRSQWNTRWPRLPYMRLDFSPCE